MSYKSFTNNIFLQKAKKIHPNFDYSKTKYKNSRQSVVVICFKHGKLIVNPINFLRNITGCKKCGNERKILSVNIFINRSKKIHGDKYDYSKTNYINSNTKVCIICPEHGKFYQSPGNHLSKHGCPRCMVEKHIKNSSYTLKEFIKKSNITHNNKYDYSKINYNGTRIKVKIICPEHGEFLQTPIAHYGGQGCPKCANFNNSNLHRKTTEQFIIDTKKIHGSKYNYTKVDYVGSNKKVCIICPKHGEFWQLPAVHYNHGCPKCNESKGEKFIIYFLEKNKIKYYYNYRFKDCRNKLPLPFDFYLPDYNTCIEYDGKQHFEPYFKRMNWKLVHQIQYRDNIKNEYCKEKNINLLRIPYTEFNNIENIMKEQICYR